MGREYFTSGKSITAILYIPVSSLVVARSHSFFFLVDWQDDCILYVYNILSNKN